MSGRRKRTSRSEVARDIDCNEKFSFDNQKQANAAKIVADMQHGTKLKVYHCNSCNLWHLTSYY